MILIIDEEKRRMMTFLETLEEYGYSVKLIDNVDNAYEYVKKNYMNISAVILDIMMPWGELLTADETQNGLLTGYKLYELLRSKYLKNTPILFYTAVNKPELFKQLRKEEKCMVFHKPNSVLDIIDGLKKFNIFPY